MFEGITRKYVLEGMITLAQEIAFKTDVLNCWERIVSPTEEEVLAIVNADTKKEKPKKVSKKKKRVPQTGTTYYAKNTEKMKENGKAHYAKNREKRKKQMKAYYRANKKRILANQRARRKANREKK